MPRGGRKIARGNLVSTRLNECLENLGRGAVMELLGRLKAVSITPGFEELANLTHSQIIRMKQGQRVCYDYELMALAHVLDVDVYWLTGFNSIPRRDR